MANGSLERRGRARIPATQVYSMNMCFGVMHVSLVMVLRAAEPLTTLFLSSLMLPSEEQPPLRKALALLPVVLGCSLTAAGEHGPTTVRRPRGDSNRCPQL